jgi:hypothetical protein
MASARRLAADVGGLAAQRTSAITARRGLVAKLAGHKSAVVTLSHYTHAMRGGEDAVKAVDKAYAGSAS